MYPYQIPRFHQWLLCPTAFSEPQAIRAAYLSYRVDERLAVYADLTGCNKTIFRTAHLRAGIHSIVVTLVDGGGVLEQVTYCVRTL